MAAIFLKTTFRSLWKNKAYSVLNIAGLGIGITFAALVFLWVEDEVTFDSTHAKRTHVYKTYVHQDYKTNIFTHTSCPGPMGPALKEEIPGVANTCRTSEGSTNVLLTAGEQTMYAGGTYAEPSLFSMFTLPFIQGNATSALAQTTSLVLTETLAKKLFGAAHGNIIGKTVRINDKEDYQVTGVLKDLPANSSLQFGWLRRWDIYQSERDYLQSWNNFGVTTYVELDPKADAAAINKKLWNYLDSRTEKNNSNLSLLAMTEWRLHDGFKNGQPTGEGRIAYVRMFSIIALIIIIIACINFMNLATARSNKQSKEVGVRKVLGAGKGSLVGRFMGESMIVSFIATGIAAVLTLISLPAFNSLVGKELSFGTPLHIGILACIALACGLLAGSYPSFYLSSFNPISVLKGGKGKTGRATFVRKGLVVVQFAVSITLIICTIIVLQQVQHVKKRNLGFDRNNLIEIDVRGDVAKHFQSVQQELLATGMVENSALADHATIEGGNNSGGFSWDGKDPATDVRISYRIGTAEFFATLGMKIKEGRSFNAAGAGDSFSVVITENLAKMMGNGSAVGKTIDARSFGYEKVKVVGVVNDYVYGGAFNQQSDPVIFFCLPQYADQYLYIRPKAGADLQTALAKIETVIAKAAPAYPFTFRFVDDQFNKYFFNEVLIGKLARIFAGLAILISCLGLFGLAAYTAEQRTREIGIRKVMGASVSGIATLLSKDFLKLVLMAAVVAFPLAWFFMENWLQGYAYRVNINWWVFLVAGSAAVIIALATISSHAIRAALVNPVKSLRTE